MRDERALRAPVCVGVDHGKNNGGAGGSKLLGSSLYNTHITNRKQLQSQQPVPPNLPMRRKVLAVTAPRRVEFDSDVSVGFGV